MANDFITTFEAFRARVPGILDKTRDLRNSLYDLRSQIMPVRHVRYDVVLLAGDWWYGNGEICRRIQTSIGSFDRTIRSGENLLRKNVEDFAHVQQSVSLVQGWGTFAKDMIPILEVAACMENHTRHVQDIANVFQYLVLPSLVGCGINIIKQGAFAEMASLGEAGCVAALNQSYAFLMKNWKIATVALVAMTLVTVCAAWFAGHARNNQFKQLKEELVAREEQFQEEFVNPLRKTEEAIVDWFRNIRALLEYAAIDEAALASQPSQLINYLTRKFEDLVELRTLHQTLDACNTSHGFEAMKENLAMATSMMEEGKANDIRKTLMFWYFCGSNKSYQEILRDLELSPIEAKRYRALLMLKKAEDPRLTEQILALVNREDGERLLKTTRIGKSLTRTG